MHRLLSESILNVIENPLQLFREWTSIGESQIACGSPGKVDVSTPLSYNSLQFISCWNLPKDSVSFCFHSINCLFSCGFSRHWPREGVRNLNNLWNTSLNCGGHTKGEWSSLGPFCSLSYLACIRRVLFLINIWIIAAIINANLWGFWCWHWTQTGVLEIMNMVSFDRLWHEETQLINSRTPHNHWCHDKGSTSRKNVFIISIVAHFTWTSICESNL